jgi:dihydroorotate dehydrogenase electron transfer subunit
MSMREHRGTISYTKAQVLEHNAFAGNQYVLRLKAPTIAQRSKPGQFVHIQCADEIPLRRPLSIMRSSSEGWIEVLYKPVGSGLAALARAPVGHAISVLGPIGNGFDWSRNPQHILALGGGVGIPPMIFAAQVLRNADVSLYVYFGSEIPFPLELTGNTLDTPGIDGTEKLAAALLSDWGIPCVLCSRSALPGSHAGFVTELADRTLAQLTADERAQTLLIACGPQPMLAASARLARQHNVECQLALEEYMACGVGGCAGCTVEVHTEDGIRMQRVCVDGPVFDAASIYPNA